MNPFRNCLASLVPAVLFIFLTQTASASEGEKDQQKAHEFSINGKCAVLLKQLEGGPASGWRFAFGGDTDKGQWTISQDVTLKPNQSQVIPIFLGAAHSHPYVLLSLNRTGRITNSGSEETLGYSYLLTVAMGLDHQNQFPQDSFRFAFAGTSTKSFQFSVYLDGSVRRSFYTYEKTVNDGQEGYRYDFGESKSLTEEAIEFSFTLLHDPRYRGSIGGDQFIPVFPDQDSSFQAVQRFNVKLTLR